MNIAIAGATWATRTAIDGLRRNGYDPIVFGQKQSDKVSGWVDLEPDVWFDRINEEAPEIWRLGLDLLFVVGLSQLVSREILALPKLGCVGFHPTKLPKGRGRAPIAWMILGAVEGAATFFQLDEGADSGPIFVQEPFHVGPDDYAQDVCTRISCAMDVALDRWLPHLEEWCPTPQLEWQATHLGVRKPHDGRLDWNRPAHELQRLVRATSQPYPGAFSGDRRVWAATVVSLPYSGVVGRVVTFHEGCPVVQCGKGLLRLDVHDGKLKVGDDL